MTQWHVDVYIVNQGIFMNFLKRSRDSSPQSLVNTRMLPGTEMGDRQSTNIQPLMTELYNIRSQRNANHKNPPPQNPPQIHLPPIRPQPRRRPGN